MTLPLSLNLPDGIDRASFLRDYWQKRPLLMRSAIPPEAFPLAPDELAGLACEKEFESRLIVQQGDTAWDLRHGPFRERDFARLPETHWTLLVQDVDKFLPDVARLIDRFDFVPGWRIDDIMISYAADQGGVGPHTDAYDVFLMQGLGRRRWRLSYRDYTDDDLLPGLEQRILAHFDIDEDWVLEPGDVLYLPPGIAHWGIAEGECMTYSLGFRSPSQQELASDWFQHLVSLTSSRRLDDPADIRPDSLAELTPGCFSDAAALLDTLPTTASTTFRLWLGEHLTEPKPQFQVLPPDEGWAAKDLHAWLASGRELHRHPFARLAWAQLSADEVALFCQGETLHVAAECAGLVRYLAESRHLPAARLAALTAGSAAAVTLVLTLLNSGILEPEGTDG